MEQAHIFNTKIETTSHRNQYTHRFYNAEITDFERERISQAEREGYIRASLTGSFLYVEFIPIQDIQKLPPTLIHITSIKKVKSIRQNGLQSKEGIIYMQSSDMKIEPEHVSLSQATKSLAHVEVSTSALLEENKIIILDPESLHGIPDEFMHSFIVYGDIRPSLVHIRS